MSRPVKEVNHLLELLSERKSWELPPYRGPKLTRAYVSAAVEAAKCIRVLMDSDPWAWRRVFHHMLAGYCLPSDVLKDCRLSRLRREKEAKGAMTELAAVKRKLEEKLRRDQADKAWNQHRTARFLEERT